MNTVQSPFAAHEVIAFVLAILAVLDLALWWRDRERGMAGFGVGMALLAWWAAVFDLHAPVNEYMPASLWTALVPLALASLCVGMVDYMQVPQAWRRRVLGVLMVPVLLSLLQILWVCWGGGLVLRSWANVLMTASVTGLSALAFWGARREPGAGHAYVGVALLTIPGVALVLALSGSTLAVLRHWGLLPVLILGLTLVTASMLRRRHALEAEVARRTQAEAALTRLNASLEETVAQRTTELQDMVDALESFNRSVSHDLRGPLGGISGMAQLGQMAMERGDYAKLSTILPSILRQAETLAALVNDMLTLARVRDAKLQMTPIDLNALLSDTLEYLRQSDPHGAPLPVFALGPLPSVMADAGLLRQVLVNLLSNALKFSAQAAEPRVEVGAVLEAGQTVIFVRDNGVGFTPEQAEQLFQPFQRLHGSEFAGHGVGLSIVKRIVERHGGRLWAQAAPGAGASFFFSLP